MIDETRAWPPCAVCGKGAREGNHATDLGQGHDYEPTPAATPVPREAPASSEAPYLRTAYGRRIELTCPELTEIHIEDIASWLSRLCRFGGHLRTDEFYSVAQHSVMVSLIVRPELALAGLLHDAAEAYLGCDVASPLKQLVPELRTLKHRWTRRIQEAFGVVLRPGDAEEIKRADRIAYLTERRDLCEWADASGAAPYWDAPQCEGLRACGLEARPTDIHSGRVQFLGRAYALGVLPSQGSVR